MINTKGKRKFGFWGLPSPPHFLCLQTPSVTLCSCPGPGALFLSVLCTLPPPSALPPTSSTWSSCHPPTSLQILLLPPLLNLLKPALEELSLLGIQINTKYLMFPVLRLNREPYLELGERHMLWLYNFNSPNLAINKNDQFLAFMLIKTSLSQNDPFLPLWEIIGIFY